MRVSIAFARSVSVFIAWVMTLRLSDEPTASSDRRLCEDEDIDDTIERPQIGTVMERGTLLSHGAYTTLCHMLNTIPLHIE